ncbi:hypothetical protein Taro_015136 [Colocasia esculenta]|uniref:Uncharacterized protein n=1 Tax=Colocasia esculenta TaxID=4460 RepID=A0A843UAR2_COLES|nr:hypothetical protein [Colocasia esculenta]
MASVVVPTAAVAGLQQNLLCCPRARVGFARRPRLNAPLRRLVVAASSSSSPSSPSPPSEAQPETAESCVNLGLSLFSKGRVKEALTQFETALELSPSPMEAQAAFYNKACCLAYRWVFTVGCSYSIS